MAADEVGDGPAAVRPGQVGHTPRQWHGKLGDYAL